MRFSMVSTKLNYVTVTPEGAEVVKELKFTYRLPTPQAKDQFRKCAIKAQAEYKKLVRKGESLDRQRDPIVASLKNPAIDAPERERLQAEIDKLDAELEVFTAQVEAVGDETTYDELLACAEPFTRDALLDLPEFPTCISIEEAYTIVEDFRQRLSRRAG